MLLGRQKISVDTLVHSAALCPHTVSPQPPHLPACITVRPLVQGRNRVSQDAGGGVAETGGGSAASAAD